MARQLRGFRLRAGWPATLVLGGLIVASGAGSGAPGWSAVTGDAAEPGGERPAALLRAAAQAWRAREYKVESFVFRWTETELVARGTDPYRTRAGAVVDFPLNDVVHESDCLLKVAGGKMRYERRGPSLVYYLGDYADRLLLHVNDEQTVCEFHGGGEGAGPQFYPVGFLRNPTPRASEGPNLHLRPLLLCYHPFATHTGEDYDLGKYTVVTPRARLEDRECFVASGPEGSNVVNVLWLDLSQQYVPLRWQSLVGGVLRIQMDVTYAAEEFGVPIPTKWNFVCYGHPRDGERLGRVHRRVDARVTEYQLNDEIPNSEFRLEKFPLGTLVGDRRRNEYYIVGEGGRRFVIRDADWENFDYYDFLAERRPAGTEWWPLATAIALFLILLTVVLKRSWLLRTGQHGSS